jgi:nucleoporin NUP82
LYEYQHKYVTALVKQLPSGTPFPTPIANRLYPPSNNNKHKPLRQGPFLLQPSPLTIEGSEGGDATDIIYTVLGNEEDEEYDGETEKLGIVMIAYQDGKVDVCLDVDKVEARWEKKTVNSISNVCLSVPAEPSLQNSVMICQCLPCTRRWIWGLCPC